MVTRPSRLETTNLLLKKHILLNKYGFMTTEFVHDECITGVKPSQNLLFCQMWDSKTTIYVTRPSRLEMTNQILNGLIEEKHIVRIRDIIIVP